MICTATKVCAPWPTKAGTVKNQTGFAAAYTPEQQQVLVWDIDAPIDHAVLARHDDCCRDSFAPFHPGISRTTTGNASRRLRGWVWSVVSLVGVGFEGKEGAVAQELQPPRALRDRFCPGRGRQGKPDVHAGVHPGGFSHSTYQAVRDSDRFL